MNKLDIRNLDLDLAAQLGRLRDTIKNSLIVDDLGGRNRRCTAILASIQEVTDLTIKVAHIIISTNNRNLTARFESRAYCLSEKMHIPK